MPGQAVSTETEPTPIQSKTRKACYGIENDQENKEAKESDPSPE